MIRILLEAKDPQKQGNLWISFWAKLQNTPPLICIWLNSSYFCFPHSKKRWEDMQISGGVFWSWNFASF